MLKHLLTLTCVAALLVSSWASASMGVPGLGTANGESANANKAQAVLVTRAAERNDKFVPPCHRVEPKTLSGSANTNLLDTVNDSSDSAQSPSSHDCCGDKADCSCDGLCNSLSNGLTGNPTAFAESLTASYRAKLSARWDSTTPPSLFRPPIR